MSHKLPVPIHVSAEEKNRQQKIGQLAQDVRDAIEVSGEQLEELFTTGKIEGTPITFQIIADHVAKEAQINLHSAERFIRLVQTESIN